MSEGLLNIEESNDIRKKIRAIVNHKSLSEFYEPNLLIYNEQEIVTKSNSIYVPDRIVINNNKATIIDYKTGIARKDYHTQLRTYSRVLNEMGYVVLNKILIYINKEISIEEVA